jgi:transcriptional regulator GlxA family with amidase domain
MHAKICAMHAMSNPVRIEVLCTPHSMLGVVCTVLDVLNALQALAGMRQLPDPTVLRWRCANPGGAPVRLPAGAWPHLPKSGFAGLPDLLLLPGWHAYSGPALDRLVRQDAALAKYLQVVHAQGGLVVGVGNGAALLGRAGLLDERAAVVPWAFVPAILRQAPRALLRTDCAWTSHDRVWTCDSPVLSAEVVLDALRQTALSELATTAALALLHSPERQQVVVRIVKDVLGRPVPMGAVERARRWIEEHFTEPYSLEVLSAAAATSPRTLLRHFVTALGQTPLAHQQSLRIARARILLETTYLTVEQVTHACGYTEAGTFRRQFQSATGLLPSAYREQHRLRAKRKQWGG